MVIFRKIKVGRLLNQLTHQQFRVCHRFLRFDLINLSRSLSRLDFCGFIFVFSTRIVQSAFTLSFLNWWLNHVTQNQRKGTLTCLNELKFEKKMSILEDIVNDPYRQRIIVRVPDRGREDQNENQFQNENQIQNENQFPNEPEFFDCPEFPNEPEFYDFPEFQNENQRQNENQPSNEPEFYDLHEIPTNPYPEFARLFLKGEFWPVIFLKVN